MRHTALWLLVTSVLSIAVSQPFDPHTPVETVDGNLIPLSHCFIKTELEQTMDIIGRQMTTLGISRPTTKQYQDYVEIDVAREAIANNTVVCISTVGMGDIGRRLGSIILEYTNKTWPMKRGNRRSGSKGFRFDGDRDDSYKGKRKCCRCQQQGEYVLDKRRSCPTGPCCAALCRALWAISGQAGDGPHECCMQSRLPCLHERVATERMANSAGARRSRGGFT